MDKKRPCLSGVVASAALLWPAAGRVWALPGGLPAGITVSTTSQKMQDDLKTLSERSKDGRAALDAFFDVSAARGAGSLGAVAALFGYKGGARPIAAPPKGLAVNVPPPPRTSPSKKPGIPQKDLNGLKSTADGNLYRARNDNRWYEFWKSGRVIEKAVPGTDGQMWNDKGEFIGAWKTALRTETENFQVVKGRDGADHIYTVTAKGGFFDSSVEVSQDGRHAATVPGWRKDLMARVKTVKAGPDGKLYAQYKRNTEDIVVSVDPSTQEQEIAARVKAEYREWTEVHTRTRRDSDGDSHTEFYTERHEERHGVDQLEVSPDGKVMTLYRGNVFAEGPRGERTLLAGRDGYDRSGNVLNGGIGAFKVDSHGNLYTVSGFMERRVSVNNQPHEGFDLGRQDLRIDDSGNVYKTERRWFKDYLMKVRLHRNQPGS